MWLSAPSQTRCRTTFRAPWRARSRRPGAGGRAIRAARACAQLRPAPDLGEHALDHVVGRGGDRGRQRRAEVEAIAPRSRRRRSAPAGCRGRGRARSPRPSPKPCVDRPKRPAGSGPARRRSGGSCRRPRPTGQASTRTALRRVAASRSSDARRLAVGLEAPRRRRARRSREPRARPARPTASSPRSGCPMPMTRSARSCLTRSTRRSRKWVAQEMHGS